MFEKGRDAAIKAGNEKRVKELEQELQKELTSFQEKKPWRERQTMEDAKPATEEKRAEESAGESAAEKPAEEAAPAAETADAK